MAEFGGRFKGDAGLIQIDPSYRNFEVLASGIGAGTTAGFWSRVDVSFPACTEPPMLFLRTTNNVWGYVAFQNWNMTGGIFTGARLIVWGVINFSWFIACPAMGKSSDGWGMRVRDASGRIVFDTGKRYLKIIDALRVGVSNGYGGMQMPAGYPGYISHAVTPEPYYCLGGSNGHIRSDEQQTSSFGAIKSRDAASVEFNFLEAEINPGAYTSYGSSSYLNLGRDWIYEVPIIVGVLSV